MIRNIKNKLLRKVFWMCVVIVLCLGMSILINPWFEYECEKYSDKEAFEEANNVIESLHWSLKVIIGPVVEELIFRGPILIFLLLSAKYKRVKGNPYIVAILVGILFGIGHISNGGFYTLPSAIFNVSFDGIMFGALVVKTRSLLPSIGAHSILNLLVSV